MRYLEHPLPPRLAEHVECVWTLEAASDRDPERVLPDGTVELVLTGEHDHAQAFSVEVADGFGGGVLDRVGDRDHAGGATVDGQEHRGGALAA